MSTKYINTLDMTDATQMWIIIIYKYHFNTNILLK